MSDDGEGSAPHERNSGCSSHKGRYPTARWQRTAAAAARPPRDEREKKKTAVDIKQIKERIDRKTFR